MRLASCYGSSRVKYRATINVLSSGCHLRIFIRIDFVIFPFKAVRIKASHCTKYKADKASEKSDWAIFEDSRDSPRLGTSMRLGRPIGDSPSENSGLSTIIQLSGEFTSKT